MYNYFACDRAYVMLIIMIVKLQWYQYHTITTTFLLCLFLFSKIVLRVNVSTSLCFFFEVIAGSPKSKPLRFLKRGFTDQDDLWDPKKQQLTKQQQETL